MNKAQVQAAVAHFSNAETAFQRASTVLQQSRMIGLASLLPGASTQVGAARRLSDIGVHASRVGRIGAQALDGLVTADPSNAKDASPTQKLLDLLVVIKPRLNAIDAELDAISKDRSAIPSSGLIAPLDKAVSEFDTKLNLDATRAAVAAIRSDAEPLKQLLGADGNHTYLVLHQNPAELRATGGFIGGVGFLSFDHGRMAPYQPKDVYEIDGPAPWGRPVATGSANQVDPPAPMVKTFSLKNWQLRDANWSPDMPTAARQAEFFLNLEAGKKVDGVIALDPYFISKVLAVVGPVQVPETGDTVNAENFFSTSLQRVDVEKGKGPGKQFLAYASKAIFARLLASPAKDWPALLQALQWGCQTRSVQAYFHDPQLQSFVISNACSGQLRPLKADGLMIVDSNINGTKDDYWLTRRFDLQLDVKPDGTVRHTLRLHYDGLTPHGILTGGGRYIDWVRIYLPPEANLVSANGASFELSSELGRRVLQGWLYVAFSEPTDVTLVYDVNAGSLRTTTGHLDFLWQKQAGRQADRISVELSLPAGWTLTSKNLGPGRASNRKTESDLSIDREFAFDFRSP
jgi:hypothetical protein